MQSAIGNMTLKHRTLVSLFFLVTNQACYVVKKSKVLQKKTFCKHRLTF